MSYFTDVLLETTKPSKGEFRPEVKEYMHVNSFKKTMLQYGLTSFQSTI